MHFLNATNVQTNQEILITKLYLSLFFERGSPLAKESQNETILHRLCLISISLNGFFQQNVGKFYAWSDQGSKDVGASNH